MPPLPPLDEPLSDQRWVTVTGDFVCVYSSMVPFIGTDLFFAPKSVLNDGIIWLMIVKGNIENLFSSTEFYQHHFLFT
jgi:hypothetical protein